MTVKNRVDWPRQPPLIAAALALSMANYKNALNSAIFKTGIGFKRGSPGNTHLTSILNISLVWRRPFGNTPSFGRTWTRILIFRSFAHIQCHRLEVRSPRFTPLVCSSNSVGRPTADDAPQYRMHQPSSWVRSAGFRVLDGFAPGGNAQ